MILEEGVSLMSSEALSPHGAKAEKNEAPCREQRAHVRGGLGMPECYSHYDRHATYC